MTQRREVSDDLKSFIRNEIGLPDGKTIHPSDIIESDYGSTGDDADHFMNRFFHRFSISRGDYDFHRYFEVERSGLSIPFFEKWYMRKILKIPDYVREQLTVEMLQWAMDFGRWDSEYLKERASHPPKA